MWELGWSHWGGEWRGRKEGLSAWHWPPAVSSGIGREQKYYRKLPEVPPTQPFIIKHHHGAHMPDLCGRGVGVQPAMGQGNPGSLLAFNIKDLG